MSILEGLFIGGVACAILSLLGMGYFLWCYLDSGRKIRRLPKKRFKNRRKNKKVAFKQKKLLKRKKKSLRLFVVLLLLTGLFSGGSAYTSYYQSTNLTAGDSDSLVKGYYLLRDFNDQLLLAEAQEEEAVKLQQNIRYLATAMASYGAQKASDINSKEGQLTLNRYYNALKQVGMNASTQTNNFYGNSELVAEFLADIVKAQEYEKSAFEYYQVNEAAFAENE